MADWFKFYENDLDETRLQYAIAKLPEVVAVWVGILSEACRHKVGTLSWGGDEIELFGFSRRLGISIAKVNEAVNLLAEIRYIERGENTLNILKWNEKQSEYCQKKTKKIGGCPDTIPTLSRQCPPRGEERRREEKRGDKSLKERASAPRPKFEAPQLEAVIERANETGLSAIEAEKFFNFYESNGWRVGRNPMKSWTAALATWKANQGKYGGAKQVGVKVDQRQFNTGPNI